MYSGGGGVEDVLDASTFSKAAPHFDSKISTILSVSIVPNTSVADIDERILSSLPWSFLRKCGMAKPSLKSSAWTPGWVAMT